MFRVRIKRYNYRWGSLVRRRIFGSDIIRCQGDGGSWVVVITTNNPRIPGDGGRCDRGVDFVR